MSVRKPTAYGFYPSQRDRLRSTIAKLLQQASSEARREEKVKGLIVPHAGYPYSGKTAAYAYQALKEDKYEEVVLLGPNHSGRGQRFSLSLSDWKTPLGKVENNKELGENILDESDAIRNDEQAHRREHSIEVQLPLLQTVLDEFKITPISFIHRSLELEELRDVARSIRRYIISNKNSLVIASSDLIHYGDKYGYKPEDNGLSFVENKDRDFIELLRAKKFEEVLEFGRETTVCGYAPIIVLLYILKDKDIELLDHSTSYEVTGDASNIVGYSSLAFY